MILIFPILIIYCLACEPLIEERSIYPTVGEYFQLEMTEIFSGQCNSYQCDGCTNEIKIYNATEIVVQNTLNQNIISVTSNETHFAALSDLYLIIYKQGNVSQEYQNLFELPENMSCINVIYTQPDTILLDCYQEDQLIFLQFNEDNFMNVYNTSSYFPQTTQIEVYFNYSQSIFILYAQYYYTYSILTLFSNQNNSDQKYKNLTVCQYQNFMEFHSSYQFIYLIQDNILYQMNINQQYQFINLTYSSYFTAQQFSVYQSLQNQGSCDIIVSISYNQIKRYLACQSKINKQFDQQQNNFLNSESIKCISNNNFIIIFDEQNLQIISNNQQLQILQTIDIIYNTQLIYNIFSNILYLFQQNYFEILIKLPALVINYQNIPQNETKIIISAYPFLNEFEDDKIIQEKKQSSNIDIQILQEFDTNIYVQYQMKKKVNFIYNYNSQQNQYIDNYSGQLINIQAYQQNKTPYFGYFQLQTIIFQQNIEEYDYKLCSILNVPSWIQRQIQPIIVLATNKSLLLLYQYNSNIINNCANIFNSTSSIEQFQLAYNIIGNQQVLIAGVQTNSYLINCIYFNYYQQNDSINLSYSNQVHTNDQFLSYLLTYEGLYILFSNSSINFYQNCTQSQVITIDQQSINKVFNQSENYSFIPTNITTNIQYLSSLLYINNQTNVLIITLINNKVIPISRIQNKNSQIIDGINLISNRLVLSFFNNQTLNFEVWNLFNIYQPYFEKNLFEINLYNLINIYSDNLFLYVQFNQGQLYIYNPALSQHSALYKNQQLNSSLICSTVYFDQFAQTDDQLQKSLLLINLDLLNIYPINQLRFMINESFQSNGLYPQVNYNITLSSNLSSYTLNESTRILLYFYNFSNIFSDSLKVNYENHIATILPIFTQLSYCYQKDNVCQNYKDSNKTCYSDQAYLVNFIDEQIFYLAQNSSIYQLDKITIIQSCNYQLIINNTNNYIDKCLASVSYYQYIFAICSNSTSTYLIQFNFTNISNPNQSQISDLKNNFSYVQDIQIVQNSIFFAAGNSIYYSELYVFDLKINKIENLETYFPYIYSSFNQSFIAISFKFLFKQYFIITYTRISYFDPLTYQTLSGVFCLLIDKQYNILDRQQIQIFLNFTGNQAVNFYSLALIQQQDNNMVALLTNNFTQFPLVMFHFNIVFNENKNTLFTRVEYLQLLPTFSSQNLFLKFLNGYLITTDFDYGEIKIYSLENHSNFNNNLLSPILMQKLVEIQNISLLYFQVNFNITSNVINYVLFGGIQDNKEEIKISQQILQINPKIQLYCDFEPKSIDCCLDNFGQAYCTNILIEQPKIILNLLLPIISIVYLLIVLYKMIFGKFMQIENGSEDEIEL